MIKKITSFGALAFSLALFGCATQPPRMVQTTSGRPEVVIATKDVDHLKGAIIGNMMDAKYTVEKDSSYMLQFRGALTPGKEMAVAVTIGNGYSTNWRSLTFTFAPTDAGTRVIASSEIIAQLPLGKVNSMSLDNNNSVFNELQQYLIGLKAKIEKQRE